MYTKVSLGEEKRKPKENEGGSYIHCRAILTVFNIRDAYNISMLLVTSSVYASCYF